MVASEAGGITQGIGAYKVQIPVDGKLQPCVFLDTPGHEVWSETGQCSNFYVLEIVQFSAFVYIFQLNILLQLCL